MAAIRLSMAAGLVLAGALGTAAARAATIAPVPGINLAPHRAVYELSLLRGDAVGGVIGLRGRLALEFADACNGFTLNQRIRIQLVNAEGGAVDSDFSLTSWESRDGLRFRFTLKNELNGQVTDKYVGDAALAGHGKAGRVSYSEPEGLTLDLPAGTIFPTEHLALLIRAAQARRQVVTAQVFDGSAEDGLHEASAFIGARLPPSTAQGLLAPVKGLSAWRVRLAYFPTGKAADLPQYEVGFRLFENGISDELVLDYGEYAIRGTLSLLEMLPDSGC